MLTRLISALTAMISALMSVFGYFIDIPANPPEKKGYDLIFDDEFDGSGLDSGKWLDSYLPHASDSDEGCSAIYRINNGVLELMLTEDMPQYACYTTMKVSSIQTFEKSDLHPGARKWREVEPFNGFSAKYGYFEMRAKLPDCGGGGHIAWWLTGIQNGENQDAEIDILENMLYSTNTFFPKVHRWNDEKVSEFGKEKKLYGNFDKTYHIYAMDWTPEGITFYVDGKRIAHTDNSPDYEMCMYLGLYTGCDWDGIDNGVYPKVFSIDYIRVYQKNRGYE